MMYGVSADNNSIAATVAVGGNNNSVIVGSSVQQPKRPDPIILQYLQKSLHACYQQYVYLERLFDENQTPIADSFINLALIKEAEYKVKEKRLRQNSSEEKNGYGRRSREYIDERMASHEQLYAVKEPLELTELFEPKDDTQRPEKVLVLGCAGIGKSTLCQYLATQWVSESKEEKSVGNYLRQKFEAVFWLKLREVASKMTERDTLMDVIRQFCLMGDDPPTQIELENYIKTHNANILFILDGYDEIADLVEKPEYSYLNRILTELSNHQNIFITSRPIRVDALGCKKIRFDRTLETMGFLNENIEKYVIQFMKGVENSKQIAESMLVFLESHPSVWGIAHIPINLELLSWLCSKGKLTLEEGQVITLSKLYQIIVDRIQEAYAQKVSEQPGAFALSAPVESKKEGVTAADHVNVFLEYLAFHAMEEETLFISAKSVETALIATLPERQYNKIQRVQLLKSATDKLGFLRASGKGGRLQLDQDHYFIHLSFQEFYAARYVARILSDPLKRQEAHQVLERIRLEKYTPRYQLMLWMSAGLLYQQGKPKNQFLPLQYFWEAILSQPRDLIGFHHLVLVMHCLDECEADNQLHEHRVLLKQQLDWFQKCAQDSPPYSNTSVYITQLIRCPVLHASRFMIDSLLEFFNKGGNLKVRKVAAMALAKLQKPSNSIIKTLLGTLRDEDEDEGLRQAIIEALGQLTNADDEAIKALLSILKDQKQSSVTRRVAAKALGGLDHKLNDPSHTIIKTLLSVLQDQDDLLKRGVLEILGQSRKLGQEIIDTLLRVLRDKKQSSTVREAAVHALCQLNAKLDNPRQDVIDALLSVFRDHDDLKWAVIKALPLVQLNDSSQIVVVVLLNTLQNREERSSVRELTARRLGELSHPSKDVITALVNALQEEDHYSLRTDASRSLSKLGPLGEGVIIDLLSILRDWRKNYRVREIVAETLGELKNSNQEVIDGLMSILEYEDDRGGVEYEGDEGDQEGVQDKEIYLTQAVAKSLCKLNHPSDIVINELLWALNDGHGDHDKGFDIRRSAVEALGNLGSLSDDVVTALINLFQDEDEETQRAAIEVLSSLENVQQITRVFECLTTDDRGYCDTYFSIWFEEGQLLCVDHQRSLVITRYGRHTHHILLPKENLEYLEQQITKYSYAFLKINQPPNYASSQAGLFYHPDISQQLVEGSTLLTPASPPP